jgi:hypothetical protein
VSRRWPLGKVADDLQPWSCTLWGVGV